MISLLDRGLRRQRHWWLGAGGRPERIAALLAAPLRVSGTPPQCFEEIRAVFAPLPQLPLTRAGAAAGQAAYRYLIQLQGRGARISCWRHYGHGIGWQRRCGPMALACFLTRFASGVSPALEQVGASPYARRLPSHPGEREHQGQAVPLGGAGRPQPAGAHSCSPPPGR